MSRTSKTSRYYSATFQYDSYLEQTLIDIHQTNIEVTRCNPVFIAVIFVNCYFINSPNFPHSFIMIFGMLIELMEYSHLVHFLKNSSSECNQFQPEIIIV